ncbi:MAG: dCMP deaminase family protein [Clostridia bacterium]|nr:dCMP deaminase family protein [Clostridia bacterium]
MEKTKWDERFMALAHTIGTWSSCYQENRHVGAVIVKNKRILTTGYNGAPAGVESCVERGECLRRKLNIPSGTRAELCYAIHAEQNAIIQAARLGVSIEDATIYCTHQPCVICAKMIVNAGIGRVIYDEGYPDEFSLRIFDMADVELIKYDEME